MTGLVRVLFFGSLLMDVCHLFPFYFQIWMKLWTAVCSWALVCNVQRELPGFGLVVLPSNLNCWLVCLICHAVSRLAVNRRKVHYLIHTIWKWPSFLNFLAFGCSPFVRLSLSLSFDYSCRCSIQFRYISKAMGHLTKIYQVYSRADFPQPGKFFFPDF